MTPARWAYRNLFDLSERVAVVTGGVGLLGQHYARGFAECGARVVVADLNDKSCDAQAAELVEQTGANCIGIGFDVADPKSVSDLVARVEARLGSVDILVNNAASKGDHLSKFLAPTEAYSLETWRQVMSVNLDGVFLMHQAIGPRMVARGRGSIINISSIYGIVGPDPRIYQGSNYNGFPISTPAIYSASKAGVIGLTRYFAALWGGSGVRVNALTPGGVESGQNSEFLRRYGERAPVGRMAEPREMVGAMLFLASDASTYVNGHNLVVDGGWSAW